MIPTVLARQAVYDHKAAQKEPELIELIERLDGIMLKRVLEIGVQEGGTFWLWTQLAQPDAFVLGVDIDTEKFDLHLVTSRHRVIEADSASPKTLQTVQAFFEYAPIDLLFIDGDHSYAGVKRDYDRYSPIVKNGGLIVFHDIAPHDPPEASAVDQLWNELEGDKWWSIFSHRVDICDGNVLPAASCGIGVLRVVK